jgi:hypothetical protein
MLKPSKPKCFTNQIKKLLILSKVEKKEILSVIMPTQATVLEILLTEEFKALQAPTILNK